MSVLQETYSGLAYVGRNTLRHPDAEESMSESDAESYDEYQDMYPERRPHVFVQFNGTTFQEALQSASNSVSGSSGHIVTFRKQGIEGNTINQLEEWRDSFTPETLEGRDVDNFTNEHLEDVFYDIESGAPFVIIDTDKMSLDVPLTVEDKREKLESIFEDANVDIDLSTKNDAEIHQLFDAASAM